MAMFLFLIVVCYCCYKLSRFCMSNPGMWGELCRRLVRMVCP